MFPCAGEAIAQATGHPTERPAPAVWFTRPLLNHRAGRCMPADNDAIVYVTFACGVAKFTVRFLVFSQASRY
jgi:hypothetical protein